MGGNFFRLCSRNCVGDAGEAEGPGEERVLLVGARLHGPQGRAEEDLHGEEAPSGARGEELRAQGAALPRGEIAPVAG